MLGAGGMGTVYLARDTRLGRKVALKFLHHDEAEPDAYARLLHEARAASTLNHPNICQVYDIGTEGDVAWIAMEYIEGQPLTASLSGAPLRPDVAVRIVKALAGALAHAHARGIIHRDLKPANVVFDAEAQPKILDFGISSRSPTAIANDITRTGVVAIDSGIAGSLPYMAPEVLRGDVPGARSDLWSLGVTFYRMLTGKLPFDGSSVEIISAILDARVPPLPPSVPAPLARVVMRLLATDQSERYASGTEVIAALDIVATDAPRASRISKAAIATGAFVLLVAGYLAWTQLLYTPLALAEQSLVSVSDTPHRSPSFSPDATMMAVVVPDEQGIPQIRVINLAQKTSIPVTSATAPVSRPRWSPKGDQIVYGVEGQGIWTVSPLAGEARRIIEGGNSPNFSRDGTRLLFETRDALWTAGVDGSNPQRVNGSTLTRYPVPRGASFSPDGREIAFFQAEAGPNGDIWIIPSSGGTARRVTSDLREGGWPVWTADGRSLIFSSARAGSRTLWQVAAKGGTPVPLTVGAGEDDEPELSADGARLAYSTVRNSWELKRFDMATRTEGSLLRRNTELLFPQFSPDGTRLVFFGRADDTVAVFTMNSDGKALRQVTVGRELNHMPRWSHDGEHIYFFQVSPEQSFRKISVLGGASTNFKPWEFTTTHMPQFDPTGRFIAYLRARAPGMPPTVPEHTVIHTIATGEEREWPEPHTHAAGWSADGREIVGWQHDGSVVICTVDDGQCRGVTKGSSPAWPLGSPRLYFARPANPGARQELWSVAVDGSDERLETTMGRFRPIDRFFTVSRDHVAAWANFHAGRHEVWTATVR